MTTDRKEGRGRGLLLGLGMIAALCSVGCQVDVAGQLLPSPYYMKDDVQYFAPGSEFKLSKEAAAMKAYKSQQEQLDQARR